jgi:tetratricopeptide (TPR) repeat protein
MEYKEKHYIDYIDSIPICDFSNMQTWTNLKYIPELIKIWEDKQISLNVKNKIIPLLLEAIKYYIVIEYDLEKAENILKMVEKELDNKIPFELFNSFYIEYSNLKCELLIEKHATIEAKIVQSKVIDFIERNKNNIDVKYMAVSYNNMALLYKQQYMYQMAEYYQKKSLDVLNESTIKKTDIIFSYVYDSLGSIYNDMDIYEEAERYYLKSLEIYNLYDDKQIETSITYNNLGHLYLKQEKYEKAEYYLQQSMNIDAMILKPDNVSISTTSLNLAKLYEIEGKYEESEKYYKKSKCILEKQKYVKNNEIIDIYDRLIDIYQKLNKPDEVQNYCAKKKIQNYKSNFNNLKIEEILITENMDCCLCYDILHKNDDAIEFKCCIGKIIHNICFINIMECQLYTNKRTCPFCRQDILF